MLYQSRSSGLHASLVFTNRNSNCGGYVLLFNCACSKVSVCKISKQIPVDVHKISALEPFSKMHSVTNSWPLCANSQHTWNFLYSCSHVLAVEILMHLVWLPLLLLILIVRKLVKAVNLFMVVSPLLPLVLWPDQQWDTFLSCILCRSLISGPRSIPLQTSP